MSDLIDRQAAIYALGEEPPVWYDGEDEIAERNQWRRDVNAIRGLPSAQPERTGKWNTYYHGDIDFSYSCNQCGYSAPYQVSGGKVFQKKWNFCPNCGARMEGDEHD